MKKNIMIVDDDADVRITIKDLFEHEGHEVYCVENGLDCLKILEKGFTGVLLLDLQIPHMDGWTTIKEIVKRKLEKNVNIIIITGVGSAHHQKMKGLEPYIHDYIVKPFDIKELLKNIEKIA